MLADAGGVLPRKAVLSAIAHLEQADRQALHRLRVRLGPLDVFLSAAAQARRAASGAPRCSRCAPASRCRRCRLPARRRSAPRPTRAARRWPTAGWAATGSASISPTGSPAMRARCGRRAATIRSTAELATSVGLVRRRGRAADERDRLHQIRRGMAMARPARRRATTARRARPTPSPNWPSSRSK